jgi:hypothetical protein
MNKKLRLLTLTMILTLSISSITGCNFFGKKEEEPKPPPPKEYPNTSMAEDKVAQDFIKTYFKNLFSNSTENYTENLIKGIIPESVINQISERTIKEGNNNPEIGIHMPRMVEFGNLVILDYELLSNNDETPMIDASYIGTSGDSFVYYVKVDAVAKGLPLDVFYDNYELVPLEDNEGMQIYKKIDGFDEGAIEKEFDRIKVRLKYDVEVVSEGASYKILTQTEANYRTKLKDRIHILNNDFIDRLPYLNLSVSNEKSIYEREGALIKAFFNNLLTINRERMALLRNSWELDYLDFMDFISSIGINKAEGKELLVVDDDYRDKFNILAFPLQAGMKRLIDFKAFSINVHPAYSQKNKVYIVRFVAGAEKTSNLGFDDESLYYYDYVVTLDGEEGDLKVSSIKLNEVYKTSEVNIKEEVVIEDISEEKSENENNNE